MNMLAWERWRVTDMLLKALLTDLSCSDPSLIARSRPNFVTILIAVGVRPPRLSIENGRNSMLSLDTALPICWTLRSWPSLATVPGVAALQVRVSSLRLDPIQTSIRLSSPWELQLFIRRSAGQRSTPGMRNLGSRTGERPDCFATEIRISRMLLWKYQIIKIKL